MSIVDRELRAAKRLPTRLAVWVLLQGHDGGLLAEGVAQLANVSRTGLGLRGFRLLRGRLPLPPYEILVVPALPHIEGLTIKAEPVRLTYGADGLLIGARIERSHPSFDDIFDIVPMIDERGGWVAKG